MTRAMHNRGPHRTRGRDGGIPVRRRGPALLAAALVVVVTIRVLARSYDGGRARVLPQQPADRGEPAPSTGAGAGDEVAPPPPGTHPRARWRPWSPRPYSPAGLAGAVLFACLSLTPSLLPRAPVFQGLITGIAAASGYGLALLATRLAHRPVSWRPGPRLRRLVRQGLAAGGLGLLAVSLAASTNWQREIHRLVGEDRPGDVAPWLTLIIAVALTVLLVATARLLRRLVALLAAPLSRRLPTTVASLLAVMVVALASGVMLNRLVVRTALSAIDQAFSVANRGTTPGIERPRSALRSGSPSSLSPWPALGVQGRDFVASGPTEAELSEFAGHSAAEPIRVYVGLQTAAQAADRAAVAVAELERTNAFAREVLCVVTTTGTGWVDPVAADALEYLHAGNTAIVATQYSYLPSWVSFLADRSRAEVEGRALFAAVHDRWSQLPPDDRPGLLVYGESLGADGSQAAFNGLGDLRTRTGGALWVGPPFFGELWRQIVDRRDPGSPERLPIYDAGLTVRFAAAPADLGRPDTPWATPRVLYLQHATDPIVWWSTNLLLRRPDWLVEPRGQDVSSAMSWYPVVTFWQVAADLMVAGKVPPGHGHRYGDLIADGWAAVAPPQHWSDADTARLRAVVGE